VREWREWMVWSRCISHVGVGRCARVSPMLRGGARGLRPPPWPSLLCLAQLAQRLTWRQCGASVHRGGEAVVDAASAVVPRSLGGPLVCLKRPEACLGLLLRCGPHGVRYSEGSGAVGCYGGRRQCFPSQRVGRTDIGFQLA
jgi:hypothetical protein